MDYNILVSGVYILLEPLEELVSNREYTVTVMPGISGVDPSGVYIFESEYSFWFTSLYCPLFSTPTKIKLEAGPSVEEIPDDTIYRMIHKNSLDAVDFYNTYQGQTVTYDYWGCSWHNVPLILRRYVECKTAYDLLVLLATLGITAGTGSQIKTLGDMTIQYGGASNSNANNSPDKKKQLYDCWLEALNTIKTTGIDSAVRGKYDYSKGFPHPVMDKRHNRIIRAVDFKNSDPGGPWEKSRGWRGWL